MHLDPEQYRVDYPNPVRNPSGPEFLTLQLIHFITNNKVHTRNARKGFFVYFEVGGLKRPKREVQIYNAEIKRWVSSSAQEGHCRSRLDWDVC